MSKRRYFEEETKRKPGIISKQLRNALDLSNEKLPLWIYRMRVLGYPPGWLKDAQSNTLTLFDDNNKCDHNLNNNAFVDDFEDGELGHVHYNKESLIEYPGFNVAVPQGVNDDWYELRMPPMLPQQQLKEALKTMKLTEPVPYKKMKIEQTFTPNSRQTSSSTTKSNIRPSVDNNSPDFSLDSKDDSHIISNDSQFDVNNEIDRESNDSQNNIREDLEISIEKTNEVPENDSFKTPSKSETSLNTQNESERKLKLISMGSPMPVSSKPSRPPLDKWSEGMGELIYFENLPTSTGVYRNKMKGVIEKIRQKNNQI